MTDVFSTTDESVTELSELVARAQAAPLQFGPIYDRYIQPVYRYIYSRVMNPVEADDLVAQTFLSALEALPRYRDKGHFSAWLFSIARSKLMDHFRKHKREVAYERDLENGERVDLLGDLIQSQEVAQLATLIRELDEDKKELLRLRYVAGLSYAEMGALLKKKEDTVKKAVYRLLERLHRQMEADNA